jgi:hypothetical protein
MASESGSDTRGPRHRFVRLAVVAWDWQPDSAGPIW